MERKQDAQHHNALDEARDLVKKRLAELDEERKRLERALAELGGKASPVAARAARVAATAAPAGPPKPPAAPRKRRRTPRRHPRRPGGGADRGEPRHHRFGDRQDR